MRRLLYLGILMFVVMTKPGWAQSLPDYYSRNNFLMAPSGVFQEGLLGFTNPANLALLKKPEIRFLWNTDGTDAASINNWGIFTGTAGLGFGALRQHFGDLDVTDYRLSTAFGSAGAAFGLSYGWSRGDMNALGRESLLATSLLLRPFRHLSAGLIGNFSLKSNAREGVAEIGIRPFGTPQLTLFADGALQKNMQLAEAPWSAGAALQVLSGINLVGRMFENDAFTVGLTINFGETGIGAQSHFDAERDHAYNTYMVRAGVAQPSIFPTLFEKNKRYLPLNLKGRVDYHKYVLFDRDTHRLLDILNDIRAAVKDERVGAIALNLSSMRVLPEHAWEIREELKKARQAGRKIIIFIDKAGMRDYHLASVADKIVMDPEGMMMLEGYVRGRTYLKGALEKLGLGFDEWRFFKYKSAFEDFSRDKMSDADREQLQNYVDDLYELVRAEVCETRRFTPEKFDKLIDEEIIFLPDMALKSGLVDTLARWSAIDKVIKNFTGKPMRAIAATKLMANALPPQEWGARPKIAVVYGLGVCAMDEGIKARWLERVFLNLAQKPSVKAVVFRVDSPGGDGMASDLVAEAIKKCSEKKPVIISQGQVAASGGYWISMYGDTIVAAPNTITGSIGVIGGWIYDKGVSEKLGMTSDHVKRGAHAEFDFGITLPFTGVRIPARNLTTEERAKIEELFMKFYEGFVQKVAKGRNMPVEEVKKIAEGHFYSGTDGRSIRLVDEVGGLLTALAIAHHKAGLKLDQEIDVIEIPRYKGFINFNLSPSLISTSVKDDPVLQYLRMLSEHYGMPLPMLLPGTYPTIE